MVCFGDVIELRDLGVVVNRRSVRAAEKEAGTARRLFNVQACVCASGRVGPTHTIIQDGPSKIANSDVVQRMFTVILLGIIFTHVT